MGKPIARNRHRGRNFPLGLGSELHSGGNCPSVGAHQRVPAYSEHTTGRNSVGVNLKCDQPSRSVKWWQIFWCVPRSTRCSYRGISISVGIKRCVEPETEGWPGQTAARTPQRSAVGHLYRRLPPGPYQRGGGGGQAESSSPHPPDLQPIWESLAGKSRTPNNGLGPLWLKPLPEVEDNAPALSQHSDMSLSGNWQNPNQKNVDVDNQSLSE